MTTSTDDPPLSPAQVGRLFGVASRTVVRWCDDGRLPHFFTVGGQRRILTSDALRLRDSPPASVGTT